MSRLMIFFVFWFLLSSLFFSFNRGGQVDDIPYSSFKRQVIEGRVAKIEVKGDEISGEYVLPGRPANAQNQNASDQSPQYFQTVIPPFGDRELMNVLQEKKVEVTAKSEAKSWLSTLILYLLPWVIIIGFFVFINRRMRQQMGQGAGGAFGFGKSKAKNIRPEDVNDTFDDVAGLENAKGELLEMVEYLKNPGKFQEIGAELPRGVLLSGPPGTGKTLMARAMAGEAGVPFFSISGSEFIEMFVGVGASRVRDMFSNAKKIAPSLIFIDELDSIGRARGTGIGGGHDEREQTLNQILSEIDGFSQNESVIVIAATNRPDVLDQALIRPGRFDRQITLDMPQKRARKEILQVHAKHIKLSDDIDFDEMASATVGFSGADLKNLINESALLAAKREKDRVDMSDLQESRDKIIMGVKREDRLSDKERKVVAYHEAGHALTALLLPDSDPLTKVTIIPRGRALGATEQIPEEDRNNLGRKYLLGRIAVMLGGRVAEETIFDEITTGAGDDLKKATQLVRRMVCQWGMSEKVGLAVFNQGEPHPFLGKELSEQRNFSEQTAREIDEEVKNILKKCSEKAAEVLADNRTKLDKLAEALMEEETLTAEEIYKLLGLEGKHS